MGFKWRQLETGSFPLIHFPMSDEKALVLDKHIDKIVFHTDHKGFLHGSLAFKGGSLIRSVEIGYIKGSLNQQADLFDQNHISRGQFY